MQFSPLILPFDDITTDQTHGHTGRQTHTNRPPPIPSIWVDCHSLTCILIDSAFPTLWSGEFKVLRNSTFYSGFMPSLTEYFIGACEIERSPLIHPNFQWVTASLFTAHSVLCLQYDIPSVWKPKPGMVIQGVVSHALCKVASKLLSIFHLTLCKKSILCICTLTHNVIFTRNSTLFCCFILTWWLTPNILKWYSVCQLLSNTFKYRCLIANSVLLVSN